MIDGRDGPGAAERVRLQPERRRALIERLNAKDEHLRKLDGRRLEAERLSDEEPAQEIETGRGRNLARLGFGQAGGGS